MLEYTNLSCYLRIKTLDGQFLYTTEDNVRCEAGKEEHFVVEIAHNTLVKADLDIGPAPIETIPEKLKILTCVEGKSGDDPLVAAIRCDLEGKSSVLELMQSYLKELEGELDNNAPPFAKLAKLFQCGIAPDRVEGHHYGVTVGLRTGEKKDIWADYGNLLGLVWSTSLGKAPPWVGKSFKTVSRDQLKDFTEGSERGDVPTYLGINHFNEVEESFLNVISLLFLSFWMHLKDAQMLDLGRLRDLTNGHETGELPTFWGANTYSLRTTRKRIVGQAMKVAGIWTEDASADEKRSFGYDMKSFFFIGRQAISVNKDNQGKNIFRFNYRWPKLKTFPPDNYCFDELVQIAEGLYLGELMYATELLKKYDPTEYPSEYKYRLFGYFLLMDEDWHRRRLKIGFDLDNT